MRVCSLFPKSLSSKRTCESCVFLSVRDLLSNRSLSNRRAVRHNNAPNERDTRRSAFGGNRSSVRLYKQPVTFMNSPKLMQLIISCFRAASGGKDSNDALPNVSYGLLTETYRQYSVEQCARTFDKPFESRPTRRLKTCLLIIAESRKFGLFFGSLGRTKFRV